MVSSSLDPKTEFTLSPPENRATTSQRYRTDAQKGRCECFAATTVRARNNYDIIHISFLNDTGGIVYNGYDTCGIVRMQLFFGKV